MDHYITEAKSKRDESPIASNQLECLRENAIKKLEITEIPNRKIENWKYTNLTSTLSQNYSHKNIKADSDINISKDQNFTNIVFINGRLDKNLSDENDLAIDNVANTTNEEAINYISKDHFFTDDFSNVFNISNLHQGNVIAFNKNTSYEKPFLFHNIFTGNHSHHNINNVFIIEESSSITILENIISTDNVFVNFSSHAMVKTNAKFEHTFLQDLLHGSLITMNINSESYKSAQYNNVIITTGAKTSRTNLYMNLVEENAFCQADGLYALHKDQHHDTMSFIHHNAPHTDSKQLYKGILGDESRGVFTGRVRVEQNAQLINAKQLNKNLLLTKKAQANSRPQLEIFADDVKCAHGSTTGQLSEDELFYFESRGINKEKARTILARAFAYDVVLSINNLKIRDFIKSHLLNKNIVR
jgi:Fe-S cluster assembly protein SufD